ncbi:MAG: nucleotidyl transferase AbiEii/AbiGii toxin family protein [Candidatus Omnitrophota bacterium]
MNFALIFKFLIENLKREKIDFALIGGFALQAVGITRTTRDIDLMVLSAASPKIKEIMLKHGYKLLQECEDILNFTSKDFELGKVDFLLAHRKYTLAMLKRAKEEPVLGGKFKIKVLSVEDQIGLKIQATANEPQRLHQDMADVRTLIEIHYPNLDLQLLKEYFALFDREEELKTLLKDIKDAQ